MNHPNKLSLEASLIQNIIVRFGGPILRENQALKELVAEKELEIRVKDALLKKTVHQNKNG